MTTLLQKLGKDKTESIQDLGGITNVKPDLLLLLYVQQHGLTNKRHTMMGMFTADNKVESFGEGRERGK